MATPSTDITFTVSQSVPAKNITITDTSSYSSGDLSWASSASRILIKIVDSQGTTFRPTPAITAPDITTGGASASLNLPTDASGNIIQGLNKVTATYMEAVTVANTDVTVATNNITITGHDYTSGDAVAYDVVSGAVLGGLTDNTIYYAGVIDASTIKLYTTAALAIAGIASTEIDITSAATSSFTLSSEKFERTFEFDNSYSTPTPNLSLSYSVINPIEFEAIDNTSYDYLSVTPTLSGTLTLTHPEGMGTYVANVDNNVRTLNTKVFYYSTDPNITSVVSLSNTATYTFQGYYSDATSVDVAWTLVDVVAGSKGIYVSGGSDGCDVFCCMKNLKTRVDSAQSSGNITEYTRLTKIFNEATGLWQLIEKAYNCGKSSDAATYTAELKDLLDCDGDCSSEGTVAQVVGIGTTPNITRIGSAVMTADVTSYTFDGLKNYSYSDGDIIITVDGDDIESIATYSPTLNTSTGEVTFGTTVYTGVKVAYHIIKP